MSYYILINKNALKCNHFVLWLNSQLFSKKSSFFTFLILYTYDLYVLHVFRYLQDTISFEFLIKMCWGQLILYPLDLLNSKTKALFDTCPQYSYLFHRNEFIPWGQIYSIRANLFQRDIFLSSVTIFFCCIKPEKKWATHSESMGCLLYLYVPCFHLF